MIRLIIFDLDGTLYDFMGPVEAAQQEVLTPLTPPGVDPAELFMATWEANDRIRRQFLAGEVKYPRVLWLPFQEALAAYGVPCDENLAKKVAQDYLEAFFRRVKPYPAAREVLEGLSRDYELAMISNGIWTLQVQKLEVLGLRHFFSDDQLFLSDNTGLVKPDPRIFHCALSALRAEPEEVVFVGDDLEADVAGATAVGIRTIWLNTMGRELPGDIPADMVVEVGSLAHVPAALKEFIRKVG